MASFSREGGRSHRAGSLWVIQTHGSILLLPDGSQKNLLIQSCMGGTLDE